jgi:HlyD family secretion protein
MFVKIIKKKWFWVVAAVIIICAAGGGYYVYSKNKAAAAAAAATQSATMQTTTATTGDITVSATGSGQVVAASEMSLGFDKSGTLIELNFGLGDKVKKGDMVARLQTQNSEEDVAASVSNAELAVIEAQQSLDALYTNAGVNRTSAINDIATYAQAVRDAQYQLENYSMPLFLQGTDAIEAVDKTKAELDKASAAFEPYKYYPVTDSTRKQLLVDLNLAQSNYDAAIKRLNYEYALQVAQANLEKARLEYDKYKDGPAADELELAQTKLQNAKDNLAVAKETQSIIDLISPMTGTVMSVDATVGGWGDSATIVTLADLDNLQIEAYLDESDLDKAVVGNEADITFDALPDESFTGKVVSVSPGLETVSNVQAVKVVIKLDATEKPVNLPVGASATVDVIAGKATGAVLISVDALHDLGGGEYGVFVVQNGTPVFTQVQVGLMDVTYAEILSGVNAGDIVSTGITQTK